MCLEFGLRVCVVQLENVEPGKEYVEALSGAMDSIQKEVASIKNSQRSQFDELSKMEQLLSRDLELMIESIQASAEHSAKPESRSIKAISKRPPPCSSW